MTTIDGQRFAALMNGDGLSGVERCRRIAVPSRALTGDWAALSAAHRQARAGSPGADPVIGANLLELKRVMALRLLSPCRQCWLRCEVDRLSGELGLCGLGAELRVYNEFIHLGEELELTPTHAVFLAGCNFRCAFCSDGPQVVAPRREPIMEAVELARRLDLRRAEGARSVSFIGGLPDVNLFGIVDALCATEIALPVVWNSNMSASEESEEVLDGLVDATVADLKFGNDACAERLAGVRGHDELVKPRILRAATRSFILVRHLVMPGHLDCCARPALDWLASALPGCRVNVMDQFEPMPWQPAALAELAERPVQREVTEARSHARSLGLRLDPLFTPRGVDQARRAAPSESVESRITISPGGGVSFENLPPSLLSIGLTLDPADPELRRRQGLFGPDRPKA